MSEDYTPSSLDWDALEENGHLETFLAHLERCKERRGKGVNKWLDKLEARLEREDLGPVSDHWVKRSVRMVELNVEADKPEEYAEPFFPDGSEELVEFLGDCLSA